MDQNQQPNETTPNSPSPEFSNPPQTGSTNGLAIAGFVLAFLAPLIGLVLSIIGLTKAKNHGGKGQGLAIAGIVISVIILPLSAVFWLTVIAGVSQRVKENETNKSNTSQVDHSNDSRTSSDGIKLGKTYQEKSGAYSLKLPDGWKATQSEASRNTYATPSNIGSDSVSSLSISVNKKFSDETLKEQVDYERETITKYSGGTIETDTDVTLGGMSGHEFVSKIDSGGSVYTSYEVIIEKGDSFYNLNYRTSPERAQKYLPVYKESVRSFTVL